MANFFFMFLWGLVVLAGFIGWGRLVARLAGVSGEDAPDDDMPDWGLAAGWGMAAVIALGGVLALLGIAYAPVLFAVVLLGVVLFGWEFVKAPFPRPALSRWAGWTLGLMGFVLTVLLIHYGSNVSFSGANCSDDDIAYFTFVTRLLETGTLLEPFSLRRLSAYGGHTVLQSLVMMAGTVLNGFLMDRGVAVIVSFGLVAGFLRRAGMDGAAPYMVALILTVIMPFPLGNSSSHITGLAMFLTLFRTMEISPLAPGSPPVKRLWLIGLVAAAASSLKAHFLGVAALTVFFFWLLSVFEARRGQDMAPGEFLGRPLIRSLVHLGLSPLVFLAPWMALLYRSSGTIVFPLFQGNHQAGFSATYSGSLPVADLLILIGRFFISPQVSLLLVPLVLYAFYRTSRPGLALYGGAVIMTMVTAATLNYDSTENLYRYVAPFLGAAFMATVMALFRRLLSPANGQASPAGGISRAGNAMLCVFAVLMAPLPLYYDINRLSDWLGYTVPNTGEGPAYGKMQAAVPPGQRVLAVVAHPFALDYRRNEIFNIDIPGGVSPAPGMPFFKGPRALKEYLLGQSIRFIAYRDFTNPGGCIYRYDWWELQARSGHPMWTAQSKYFLDFMKNVEALEKTETVTYRGRVLRVMRLR